MRWLSGFGLVVLTLGFASHAGAQTDARASRILNGLEPKFYVAGRARKTQSLAERMRYYRVPAVSIAVIDNYQVVWKYAAGYRDFAANARASPTTLFQAASMSKPFAAAAILRLFEVKNLDLNADVNTMLTSWKVPPAPDNSPERVTMRRLLSHTAGTNVHGFLGYDRDAPLPTLVQVLNGVPPSNSEAVKVTAVPGTKTEYSGGGTSIAQLVAVDESGQPFAEFMQKTLLDPLGMTNSTFDQPLPQALWPRAASGYYADGKPVHRGWHVYPTMAAAGLWTTPTDLCAFIIAIQNALRGQGKPPIDATVAHEMTTKVSEGFGMGPEVADGYFAHNGANEGFQGTFYGLTKGGKGIAVMTNSNIGVPIAEEVVHAVARAYDWPVLQAQPKKAVSVPVATLRDLVGKYSTTVDGEKVTLDASLVQHDGAPALLMNSPLDFGPPLVLYSEAPLRFFTLAGTPYEFVRGKSGHATAVKLGTYTFNRAP